MVWRRAGFRVGTAVFMTFLEVSTPLEGNPYPEMEFERCFESSQGTMDRTGITIRLGHRNWLSAELATRVTLIVLREFLNYNVVNLDLSSGATKNWGADMEADLFDLEMESWQAGTSTDMYLTYVVDRQVVKAGHIGYTGRSGLFTTPEVLEAQPLADYFAFYKNASLVKDAGYVMFEEDNRVKDVLGDSYPVCTESEATPFCGAADSRFENYYVPPQCTEAPKQCGLVIMAWATWEKAIFEQLTTNHHLKMIHTWGSGKVPTLVEDIIEEGRQTVFYWWVPDPFPARVNAARISFPDYTFGCNAGDTAHPSGPLECDYPDSKLGKLARSKLRDTAPEAFYFWKNIEIYLSQVDDMLATTTDAGGTLDSYQAACQWIKENRDVVNKWAPPCITSPSAVPENGELVFDEASLTCKVVARFPETEIEQTCFKVAPAKISRSDQELRVAERGWASHGIAAAITALILKEFLGYKVFMIDTRSTSSSTTGPDMDAGGFDMDMESWQASEAGALYQTYVKERGIILNPGPIGYTGRSGLFTFSAVVDKDILAGYWRFYKEEALVSKVNIVRYPGPPQIDSMQSALGEKFPFCTSAWCPENSSPFYGYWVPPQCEAHPEKCLLAIHPTSTYDEAYFEQLTRNLGLYFIFAYYGWDCWKNPILDTYEKGVDNLVFYYWEPDPIIARVSAVRLSFPDYVYACDKDNNKDANTGPVKCDYGETELQKLIRKQVRSKTPEAYMFLKNFQLLKDDIDGALGMHEDGGGNLTTKADVACWWAKKNEAKIRAIFAPPCISDPTPVSELKIGDRIFDPASLSCTEVSCKKDEVLETEGRVRCRKCDLGQVPKKDGSDCRTCEPGMVPDRSTGECVSCPMGFVCQFNSEFPEECEKGTYTDKPGASEACFQCPNGKYQSLTGQSACSDCPSPMTTQFQGARQASECVCPEGMYKPLNVTDSLGHPWDNWTTVCLPCPTGMRCVEASDQINMPCSGSSSISRDNLTIEGPEGKLYPVPPKMYYSSCQEELGLSCFKCLSENACPGFDVDECADGMEGIACGRCKDGLYKFDDKCHVCNDVEGSSVLFPILPILAAFPMIVVLYHFSRDKPSKWNTPGNYLPSALFVLLVYIQTLAAISACYLAKPKPMTDSTGWSEYTFQLLSLFRPSCTTFTSFQLNFVGQILLPVYALVLFVAVFIGSVLLWKSVPQLAPHLTLDADIMVNLYFSLFNTFFIGIAQQAFTLFQCYEHPNGEMSLRVQADVLCQSSIWNDLLVVALIAVIIFCGGFLALNVYVVMVAPRRFAEVHFQMRWKFVFLRYRPNVWWWGLVMLLKGICLNLPTVIFDQGALQIIWLQALLVTYFVMVFALFPWRSFMVCVQDILQHAFLIFLFGLATHFIPTDDEGDDNRIGRTYAVIAMGPLVIGVLTILVLLHKRIYPKNNIDDWILCAEELCTTFSQINDPQLLAKILSQMVYPDIMTINGTRAILEATYLFHEKREQKIDAPSPLLRFHSSGSRIMAEHDVGDYMGQDYVPKLAKLGSSDLKPLVEQETKGQPEVTSGDLLDSLDFPTEQMHGLHVMSHMLDKLVTPRWKWGASRRQRPPANAVPKLALNRIYGKSPGRT